MCDMYSKQQLKVKDGSILVIGDTCIDTYITGAANRMAYESPTPIISSPNTFVGLGMAANVARCIHNLGVNVHLVSVEGKDALVSHYLPKFGFPEHQVHLVRDESRVTTNKTRVLANGTQVCRIDVEHTHDIGETTALRLNEVISQIDTDMVVLVDYNKGLYCNTLFDKCNFFDNNRFTLADMKPCHIDKVLHANIIKMNSNEMSEALYRLHIKGHRSLNDIIGHNTSIVTTKGANGVQLSCPGSKTIGIDGISRPVVDTTGCGDMFTALLAIFTMSGYDMIRAVKYANVGASYTVQTKGNGIIDLKTLEKEIYTHV